MKMTFVLLVFFFAYANSLSQGWVQKTVGTSSDLYSVYFVDADTGYTVGQFGVIFKTTDGADTWTEQTSGVSGLNSVYFTDASTGYAVGPNGVIIKTTNGGENWTMQTSGTDRELYQVQFVDGNTGYVGKAATASDPESILKTTNGGTDWTKLPTGTTTAFYSIYFTSASTGYGGGQVPVGANAYLLKTTDTGVTWTNQNSNTGGLLLSLFFPSADTGFACGGFSSAVRTTNGGVDWVTMSPAVSGTYNSLFFTSADTGYIAGQSGTGNLPLIMKTTDGGGSWIEQPLTQVGRLQSVFFVDANTGFACGTVGLMLKTTTSTGIVEHSIQPQKYSLHQNHPNPFNPTTNIRFQITDYGFVSLKVYDVLGREVAILVNAEEAPGTYQVVWDGSAQASGVYLYRLQARGFSQTKKLVLMR